MAGRQTRCNTGLLGWELMGQSSLWRADGDDVANAKPVLRWAGGKTRWLRGHHSLIPSFTGRYFEPFLGGGAVFFHLTRRETRPFHAFLSDTNLQLISTYSDLRDSIDSVIDECKALQAAYSTSGDKRAFYERQRDIYNDGRPRCNAANFIFLNQTCWNGLWRVNRNKEFNVPFGAPKSEVVMPSEEQLRTASIALQTAELRASSWESAFASSRSGDFVFVDPPYLSDFDQNGTKYGREQWGFDKHQKLAEACVALDSRGVKFVLTNSGEVELEALYRDLGLNVQSTFVSRAINSKPELRGGVRELIVSNAPDQTPPDEQPRGRVFSLRQPDPSSG